MNEEFRLTHPDPHGLDHDSDFWPTPRHAIRSLLLSDVAPPREDLICEPCCGDGAIVRVLIEHGYLVNAADIRTEAVEECSKYCDTVCMDVLSSGYLTGLSIVTNPPFGIARQIVAWFLMYAPRYMAMLLRCNVLGSNPWSGIWNTMPPTAIRTLRKRPSFSGDGKTDASEYGWFVWDEKKQGLDIQAI